MSSANTDPFITLPIDGALSIAELGVPVAPVKGGEKAPPIPDFPNVATTDEVRIKAWHKERPNCNWLALARPDGVCFIDEDQSERLRSLYQEKYGEPYPRTRTTESQTNHRQSYWRQTDRTRAFGNHAQSLFIDRMLSFRQCDQYCMVEGSHLNPSEENGPNHRDYILVDESPIAEMPDRLMDLIESLVVDSKRTKEKKRAEEPKMYIDGRPVPKDPPDPGFKRLFDVVGWNPLVRRLNKHMDDRYHDFTVGVGEPNTYCPIPSHGPQDVNVIYKPCFGVVPEKPVVLHCLICEWSGDMVAACYEVDGDKTKNMYDVARAICMEENLNYQDFFPQAAAAAPAVESIAATNVLKATRGDMIKPKTIKWLWSDRIPFGKLSVFAGDPDQGKSLVTMYLTSVLTTGRQLYGSTTKFDPCDVLILAGEDEADDTVVPRLIANGADLKRVQIVESVAINDGKGKTTGEREAQLDLDMQAIEDNLKANPQIRLVIIDPLSNYLGNANMNREQEVRRILIPLKNMAARMSVAVVAVMHLNKTSDASAIHRIGGAVAFTGVARACWLFMADTEDRDNKMMLRIKGNIAKRVGGLTYRILAKDLTIDGEATTQPYVEWTGETDSVASDVLIGGAPAGRPNEKVLGAKEWLARYLEKGPETAADVTSFGKKVGFSRATLRRAKDDLHVVSYQEDRVWLWELPKPGARIIEEPIEPVNLD